jgi:hypothetical protein
MRLSEWRASSPSKAAGTLKISAIVDPVLQALGAEPDPHCWVAWGEDPAVRYTIFVPTPAGLITSYVRVNVSGEGPRATAKLIRWSRVQLGELSLETQADHRLLTFQVEQHVLHGADDKADQIGRFALELMAAVDGRELPPRPVTKRRSTAMKSGPAGKAAGGRTAAKASVAAKTATPAKIAARPTAASPRPAKPAAADPRARRTAPSR